MHLMVMNGVGREQILSHAMSRGSVRRQMVCCCHAVDRHCVDRKSHLEGELGRAAWSDRTERAPEVNGWWQRTRCQQHWSLSEREIWRGCVWVSVWTIFQGHCVVSLCSWLSGSISIHISLALLKSHWDCVSKSLVHVKHPFIPHKCYCCLPQKNKTRYCW